MGLFDGKNWNSEVFQKYTERIPNLKRDQLIKSGAIRMRPDLAAKLSDDVGGNYITTPLKGLIGGAPANYDGVTNMPTSSTLTFTHSRIVTGRMNSWTERDFSYDITGGYDALENVAEQVNDYWNDIDQATLIDILTGIFSMTSSEGQLFVNNHTYDITANAATAEVEAGCIGGTTVNTAIQRACGDNKGKFSLVLMHSVVATNLENLKLLAYMKGTDSEGIQRDLTLATINGKLVLIDDAMPSYEKFTSAGVYAVEFGGTFAQGDKVVVDGTEITVGETVTAAAIASQLETALAANTKYTAAAGTGADSGKLILTEKSGKYGTGAPVVSKTSTAGTVAAAVKTAAVSVTVYITFVLGNGAFELTDCGAKVPNEVHRDPNLHGGEDTLICRQRKCFAPYGIDFTKAVMSTLSPEPEELRNGANWDIVNSGGVDKVYMSHKAIPIARIISLG